MIPACAALPAWNGFVIVPKFDIRPDDLRGAERDGDRGLLGVQLAQFRAGRGGGGRAVQAGRMPALFVQQPGLAQRQFSPDLVAGDIGGDHVGAG